MGPTSLDRSSSPIEAFGHPQQRPPQLLPCCSTTGSLLMQTEAGKDQRARWAAYGALSVVERADGGRETLYYQLADDPARALCHLVLGEDFVRRMMPVLERSLGAGCWQQIEESLWVGGMLCDVRGWTDSGMLAYEGFTVRRAGSLGEGPKLEEKALFVKFPRAHGWLQDDFTTALVALLELTEEVLRCDRLFICLERDEEETNSLVRSLMFAGFHLAESFGPLVGHDPYLTLQYEVIKADIQCAAINN